MYSISVDPVQLKRQFLASVKSGRAFVTCLGPGMTKKRHPDQATAIAPEIGCPRFRPEEVAAASGMKPHPIDYKTAMPVGKALFIKVKSLSESSEL
jgi:hypothetical protein